MPAKFDFHDFCVKSHQIHKNKYDYSLVRFQSSKSPVEIICPKHGIFLQKTHRHRQGYGCQKCGHEETNKSISNAAKLRKLKGILITKKSTEDFIKESKSIHGENRYDYSRTQYVCYSKAVNIVCSEHGLFSIYPGKHLSAKRGCKKCAVVKSISMMSNQWLDSIKIHIREYNLPNFKYRPVDGYDPLTKTVYQFHGDFFHGNPDVFKSGINPLCKKNILRLVQRNS